MYKTLLATLLSAAFLSACGGGSDDTLFTEAGSQTGILTDGPVGGVAYTTSGGYSGVTGADGSYAYNPGETVTFKIGAITLGTVTATGTVTPLDLAASAVNKENVATNLLVLLQSLDADGDASNGITINEATKTIAASAAAIDLTLVPATFASTANTALTTVMNSAGVPKTTPVSEADALAHFKSEFFKNLAGAWTAQTTDSVVTIRFDISGHYILGEAGEADEAGHSGSEVGQIDWNPKTGAVTLVADSIIHDSTGEWGLDQANGSEVVKVEQDKLTVTDPDGTVTTFVRVENDATSIVGMWALGSATVMNTQTFTFFDDGTYLMADPLGDTESDPFTDPSCGDGGVEYGTYSFNATTGRFTVSSVPGIDTNGCAGAWDNVEHFGADYVLEFNEDNSTFTMDGTVFHRISQ